MKSFYALAGLMITAAAGLALLPAPGTPVPGPSVSTAQVDWDGSVWRDADFYEDYYAPQLAATADQVRDWPAGSDAYSAIFSMPAAMAQDAPPPEAEPAPAPESVTLGESMVMRLAVQREIRDAVKALAADGLTVQIDLTPVVQQLQAANTTLASVGNRLVKLQASVDAIAAKPAAEGGGGLTAQQMQALTDSIGAVAQSLKDLGATVEGLVDQPLTQQE